ncbi:MFS transporter [Dactylosporangium roseum]|uniref:MFS transporter n=1 Tax=Dactylosporangium roseum TaxID=47989 RepID=UPI0021B2F8F0|nr:MFS transporter [Dactylosporangium roseum]
MRTTFIALRERNFRIWMGADFVSVSGTWMQALAINWYVLQATGSVSLMGLTVLMQTLPVLLLSSWAGALADRLPGRPLLVCTQLAHAALAAVLAAAAWGHLGGIGMVYVISAAGGVVNAIESPVMGRFTSTIVDRSLLTNALSLGSLVNSTGRIIGMTLGGTVAALVGPAPLFAGNAISFLGVLVALLTLRPRYGHPQPASTGDPATAPAHGVRAGFRYLLRQPIILITLALAVVLGSLGRNYQVTMAAMSNGPLHAGAPGYGLLSAFFAAGTAIGSLAAARQRDLSYQTLIGAGLLSSVLQLFCGLAPGVWSFAALMLPIGAGAVLIDTTVSARVQLDTLTEMRGRMLAAMSVASSLSGALGAPLLGWLAERAGPRETLVLAGTITAVACLAAGMALSARHNRPLRPAAAGRIVLAAARRRRPVRAANAHPVGPRVLVHAADGEPSAR